MGIENINNEWVLYALFGMLSFTAMQLLLKRSTAKTDAFSITIILTGGVALYFIVKTFTSEISFPEQMFVWVCIFGAVAFNTIGSYSELVGVKYTPNPGYIAAIKSGQVVIITIASLYLFEGVSLTVYNFLAILLVIIGVAGIALTGGKTHKVKVSGRYPWPVYGLITLFAFAGVVLTYRYIKDIYEIDVITFNLLLWCGTWVTLLMWGFSSGKRVKATLPVIFLVLFAALFGFLGNYFDFTAVGLAENPGYATAIKGGQVFLIALLAPLVIRGVSLDKKRQLPFIILSFLGVLGIVLG